MRAKADHEPICRSVVAIAQAQGRLRAVELRGKASAFELLWTKTGEDGLDDWRGLAADCGIESGLGSSSQGDSHRSIVVGFGSAGVAFYQLDVPASSSKSETASIVRLQAESRLPLSAEQMQIAWRAGRAVNGQLPVTMAAARTDRLEEFVGKVRELAPARIMLDCEGIVSAWRGLFGGEQKLAVVLDPTERSTQVCLAVDGRLANSVILDMGTEDFVGVSALSETGERLARDLKSVVNFFGYSDPQEVVVDVLSDGGAAVQAMVSALQAGGLKAREVLPKVPQTDSAAEAVTAERLYEYRLPIGLGLLALDGAQELNIFESVYAPSAEEQEKDWMHSPRLAAVIAGAMLVLLLVVSYAVDAARPGVIDKKLKQAFSEADMKQLMDRQSLRKAIAGQRPDILELITLLNESGQGIKLDALHFKKGQLATVSGQAPGNDQLYKFEETLNTKKGISEAKIQTSSFDSKSKKIRFTIGFKYKTFSNKGSSRAR